MRRPSRTRAVFRKELIQIARDPRSLAIALLMPVMMLFIYGYGISSDIDHISLGVVDWSRTPQSRSLLQSLTNSGYFVRTFSTDRYSELGRALDGRRIKVGVVIPADYSRCLLRGLPATVQVIVDGSEPNTATVAVGYVESILESDSFRVITNIGRQRGLSVRPEGFPPIDLRVRVWYNEGLRSVNFIVPGLIAVILMVTSSLLTSGAIARERERGTVEQLVASPLKAYELMLGKIGAYALLSMVDVLLVVLVGTLWFGVPLRGSILLLIVCSFLFLMSALGIGLLISASMPTQQTAMSASSMLNMVPSILLSGFFFPIGSMPKVVQYTTVLVPARYFMVIVRGIFLKGIGLEYLWQPILSLALFGIVLLTGSILAFRKRL